MSAAEFRELVYETWGGPARTPERTQAALAILERKHAALREEKAWYVLLAIEQSNLPT